MTRGHLVGLAVALASGFLTLKQARVMMHEGVSIEEGGGWAAVFLAGFIVHVGAVSSVLAS